MGEDGSVGEGMKHPGATGRTECGGSSRPISCWENLTNYMEQKSLTT